MNTHRTVTASIALMMVVMSYACSGDGSHIFYETTPTPSPTRPPTQAADPTATPTVVILVSADTTGTPAPGQPPTPTPTPTPGDEFTITGTTEEYSQVDQTYQYPMSGTSQDILRQVATFTLTAVEGHRLKGTAQVTFTSQGFTDLVDLGTDYTCQHEWNTGPLTWTADLEGEYERNPDGSIMVLVRATPEDGPAYSEKSCATGEVTGLRPSWPGAGGTLVNGVYDRREEPQVFIPPPNMTVQHYTIAHMELSRP